MHREKPSAALQFQDMQASELLTVMATAEHLERLHLHQIVTLTFKARNGQ